MYHEWGRIGMHNGYWWESQKERPQGRPKNRWVDNIKIDLRDIGWDATDWIDLAQDKERWKALVNAVKNFRVP
jgi:hypothetical protein